MKRLVGIVCASFALLAVPLSAAESAAAKGALAIGYDEGISAKYYLTDKLDLFIGAGYYLTGADTINEQPLNSVMAKIGVDYLVWDYSALRVNLFLDIQGNMYQEQFAAVEDMTSLTRANVYGGRLRIGFEPELFLHERFSVSYRFGGVLYYNGTRYELNEDGTSTKSKKSDYFSGGIFGNALNIGIHIYFTPFN